MDVPVLPTQLPGIDVGTTIGYRLMYIVHAASICVCSMVLFCSDLIVYLLALFVCPMAEVLAGKLATLELVLMKQRMQDSRHQSHTIICIVRLHQQIGGYLTDLARLFYALFMIDVLLAGMSMCMALFAWLQLRWIPLYGLFGAYLVKLFATCAMGTLVDNYVSYNHVNSRERE